MTSGKCNKCIKNSKETNMDRHKTKDCDTCGRKLRLNEYCNESNRDICNSCHANAINLEKYVYHILVVLPHFLPLYTSEVNTLNRFFVYIDPNH